MLLPSSCFENETERGGRNRSRPTAFLPLPPAKGKQSLHIAFLHIFHSDWRWGDCPFVPPLDARFFRFEQAACRATAVRLRRRGYAYPGGIAENGLIIMAGVVTPACFRRAGGVCTRDTTPKYIHATLLERSSPFPTHPLPERGSSNKRNKRRRDFLSFSHSLRVLRVTESINLSLSLPLVFSAAWNLISASRLDEKAGIRFLESLYLCTPLGNEGGWNNGHHHRLSYDRYRIVGKRGVEKKISEAKRVSVKSERFSWRRAVSVNSEKCRGMSVEWKVAGKSLRVSINKPCMVMYSRPSR